MTADEQFRTREVVFDAGDGTARLGFPARLLGAPAAPARPDARRRRQPRRLVGDDDRRRNVTGVAVRQARGAPAPISRGGRHVARRHQSHLWRTHMLMIVGLLAVAGLSYFLVKSRKQTAKSAR